MLLDRNDRIINILEVKFYNTTWVLDKETAIQLREKMTIFKSVTQTNKQVLLTLISTFGIKPNTHSVGLVNRSFNADILFEPID